LLIKTKTFILLDRMCMLGSMRMYHLALSKYATTARIYWI